EKTIAGLLRKQLENVISDLQMLHANGIIEYKPQKDSPQLYVSKPRIPSANIYINQDVYRKRKESYQARVESMLQYLETNECRSVYISNYFGERNAQPCGICDSCLDKKNSGLTKEEFEGIYKAVVNKLHSTDIPAGQLIKELDGIQKSKLKQVIDFLRAENKLKVNKDGFVKIEEH
ncbi:MAG TPA: RecQ family zinc-binding domain-containing protein, partial [Puia sp.]|nr:RecQ family zinc-binding domain-containing protein [Puia sp.]